jgi:ATP synthase protein I
MVDELPDKSEGFAEEIGEKEDRKLKARRERNRGLWYGLGMFGLVGWSVSIPALIFLSFGIWIDTHYPSRYSWTLMLLVFGIGVGCLNAWYWVSKESKENKKG